MTVVILGCGYTGERVARRMVRRGAHVICTSRDCNRLASVDGVEGIRFDMTSEPQMDFIPSGSAVLYSIPPIDGWDASTHWAELALRQPGRVVYLSTTGVYGDSVEVNEMTAASPRDEHDRMRLQAEAAVLGGPWSSMVLRPAAIYGPGRGIHVSMARGSFRLVGTGNNYVSRIHVDDLAAHVEAALLSDCGGVWPVADNEPCTSREIAEYCAELLGIGVPESVAPDGVHRTRRANRKVDGSAIRRRLGIELKYPTYRDGIAVSLP